MAFSKSLRKRKTLRRKTLKRRGGGPSKLRASKNNGSGTASKKSYKSMKSQMTFAALEEKRKSNQAAKEAAKQAAKQAQQANTQEFVAPEDK